MQGHVTAMGAVNVDILYGGMPRLPGEGEEIYSKTFDLQLGGGAAAVIIHLSRLGVPALLGTYIGIGLFSRFIESELQKESVRYVNLYQGNAEPLVITSIASMSSDRSFISYKAPEEEFKLTEGQVYEIYKGSGIAYCTPGYDDVWKKLKSEGTVLLYDIGWHDGLCLDWLTDTFKYIDYFTPNEKEAMKITGAKTPLDALNILSEFQKTPIVKLGKNGCLVKENENVILVSAVERFKHVDSTGAGDAFTAGFIYGLFNGYSVVDSIVLGNIIGGNCVTQIGCVKARIDLETFLSCYDEEKGQAVHILKP